LNLRHDALGGPVRQHDVDACDGRPALYDAQPHLLVACAFELTGFARAVFERPGAPNGIRRRCGEHDADAMVAGRQIDFARAVALAEFHQPAGTIDAQAFDRIAGPAAAVALDRKPPLGTQDAVVAPGGEMALEIGFAAEQAKAILDLPLDPRLGAARRLRKRGRIRDERKQKCGQGERGKTHGGCGQV